MSRKAGCLLLMLFTTFSASADGLDVLRHNPFRQPEIVRAPPPPPPSPVQNRAEEAEPELRLSATMVSVTTPMVVVNGELLGVGEAIEGLRLIAVEEGRATFVRDGQRYSFELAPTRPKQ